MDPGDCWSWRLYLRPHPLRSGASGAPTRGELAPPSAGGGGAGAAPAARGPPPPPSPGARGGGGGAFPRARPGAQERRERGGAGYAPADEAGVVGGYARGPRRILRETLQAADVQ